MGVQSITGMVGPVLCFHGLVYIVVRDWSPGFQAGGVVGDEAGAIDRGWIKRVWEPPYKV